MKMGKSAFLPSISFRKAGRLLPDRWKEHLSRLADLKGGADSREEMLSDYRVYHLTGQEWIRYLLEGTAVCAVTAYVFYRSFLAFVLMLPAGMLRPFFKRRELCRRRKEKLRLQFKEAIQIVASALAAGYSVENAFIASVRDLEEQYGKEGMITREFSYLASQLLCYFYCIQTEPGRAGKRGSPCRSRDFGSHSGAGGNSHDDGRKAV